MKLTETKIYLKFILWFFLVSVLPLAILFFIIYLYFPGFALFNNQNLRQPFLVGIFVASAAVLSLSMVATRLLSKIITEPISASVKKLTNVTKSLLKSVQTLSDITRKDKDISQFLLSNSKEQDSGLKIGSQAADDLVKSFNAVAEKTGDSARDLQNVDRLAEAMRGEKAQSALKSLGAIKQLATENQKLTQALATYADHVKNIAKRVEALSEVTKFLSLNVSIEANKSSFGGNFSTLVSQIRELNISTEQAANSIHSLAVSMQEQISRASEVSSFQYEESDKIVNILRQSINFLTKIMANVSNISKNVQAISTEAEDTKPKVSNIEQMINALNKQSKDMVKRTDNIDVIINEQMVVSRALERSGQELDQVANTLNDLAGSK